MSLCDLFHHSLVRALVQRIQLAILVRGLRFARDSGRLLLDGHCIFEQN